MNEYVLRIRRSSGLEKSVKKTKRRLLKKELKLDEIRNDCQHEIVVVTEEERCYGGYDDNVYKKCLLCGTETSSRRSLRESQFVIDVSDFKKENLFTRDTKFKIVKDLFIQLSDENPELALSEIVDLVKKQLKSEDEEFRKAMDEIHKN